MLHNQFKSVVMSTAPCLAMQDSSNVASTCVLAGEAVATAGAVCRASARGAKANTCSARLTSENRAVRRAIWLAEHTVTSLERQTCMGRAASALHFNLALPKAIPRLGAAGLPLSPGL